MAYLLHILILINIYIIIAISLNLIAGYTGILSIAHAAFYGVGAYVAALFAVNFGTPFLLNLIIAMAMAGAVAAVVAFPSLRIHDDYLVIATFGFQMILFSIFNNWVGLTRGPLGIPGIPQPNIFGFAITSHVEYLALSGVCALAVYFFAKRVIESPFGRVLKAIREDEIFTQALGKNVTRYKILVFVMGGALVAIAGALYAHYVTFIDPTSFTILESIFMISIVIVGGAGSLKGSVVGAAVLIVLPEMLRFLGMPNAIAANMRQIIYGALLVVMMIFRPKGLVGEYELK
ncbi:branched-chain amino acid ABC transporter permease [candidate division KSB1 bacterium]|nr:branched-chain amino acid ABC transporter permease [Chlorobi bacterium CHB1]MDL1876345.1 branched-chain amino acid ABC transporter permease [Cytophagia bacterium CHB2]RIK75215.1 MAG: branched-chain amino acid ABC transporter permease [candidate division KSB1 bacterium]